MRRPDEVLHKGVSQGLIPLLSWISLSVPSQHPANGPLTNGADLERHVGRVVPQAGLQRLGQEMGVDQRVERLTTAAKVRRVSLK